MSVQAMTWAFAQEFPEKRAATKFVLVALANRANEAGITFAGQRTIAAECSMSERSVRRHQLLLTEMGLIQKIIRRRSSDRQRTSDYIVLAPCHADPSRMLEPDQREHQYPPEVIDALGSRGAALTEGHRPILSGTQRTTLSATSPDNPVPTRTVSGPRTCL
jgi:hypothetical protein